MFASILLHIMPNYDHYGPNMQRLICNNQCCSLHEALVFSLRNTGGETLCEVCLCVVLCCTVAYCNCRTTRNYRVHLMCGIPATKQSQSSINSNQLMHISVFIKNTLKVYLKFLLPRHVSDHIGIHPQGAIIRS